MAPIDTARGIVVLALLVGAFPLDAQVVPGRDPATVLPRQPEPERELDKALDAEDRAPTFVLPELEPPRPDRLSQQPTVHINAIELSGNSVISDAELQAITADYTGREVSNAELQALRNRLTLRYVEAGYINSGAVIPDQEVVGGVLEIRIVEGGLSGIELTGNTKLRDNYLIERLKIGAGAPLNIESLREQLRLMLQDPLVSRINAELVPGSQPGEAVLVTEVEEGIRYILDVSLNNRVSPSIGGKQVKVTGGNRNFLGFGDEIILSGGFTQTLLDFYGQYAFPITARDVEARAWYIDSSSTVVEAPFDALDIESKTRTAGIGLDYPLIRNRRQNLLLTASFERRRSKTFLLGIPFSFSPGVRDGKADVSVARLTQAFTHRGSNTVVAARSTFSLGLDALGATIGGDGPDGRFFSWRGQAQWVRRFKYGDAHVRGYLQVADVAMLPLEKIEVGGTFSVRGYRENQLVRDQGFALSAEFRVPLVRREDGRPLVQIAPFIDVGGAWEIELKSARPSVISSAGAGLIIEPTDKFRLELYWGHAFKDIRDGRDDDLQDDGIHFNVAASVF